MFIRKQVWVIALLSVIAPFVYAQNGGGGTESKVLQSFIKTIKAGEMGGSSASIRTQKIAEGLYKVDASLALDKDLSQQGGWSVNITPAFEGSFHWSPHLTPSGHHIIADHVFRAPAMVWSSPDKVLTIIPDLDARAKSPYRWFMDLNVPGQQMAVGLSDYVVREHVLFHKRPATHFKQGDVGVSFYVMISEKAEDIANPWRRPLALMWEKYGKKLSDRGEPLNRDLTPYVEHTYRWAFDTWKHAVWQEFELNGRKVGAPCFIVNFTQSPNYPKPYSEREFRSIWNQAWFCSLRSAQGLFRYARRTNNAEYLEKAKMTKELALSFPQSDGLFPGVIATEMHRVDVDGHKVDRSKGWDTRYFGNSNRNPYTRDPKASPYHILDMSCTAYFMLTWYEELEKDERLIKYARSYADKLLSLQDKDGFFPAWIHKDTLEVHKELAQSPETSKSVTFLLKLAELTGEEKYELAALKAMDAVAGEIVQSGRWEDFETYWSCSRWGSDRVGQKVERNNMYKQNNFSIYWTAEALLNAYERTQKKSYLELGQRTLDELLMTQAVWQPPYMHVKVFGCFGVMNADGEWNDARQSVFSELIIRYGKVLNHDEYTRRGIAALKASFNMMYCPENEVTKQQWEKRYRFFNQKDYGFMMENYGHGGYADSHGGGIGTFTIYDWGNGSASEAYNRILDRYDLDLNQNR